MALDVCHEHGGGEFVAHHVAFQPGHVDAVGGEAPQGLVQRGGHVADPEDEAGDCRSGQGLPGRQVLLPGQHHKAGGVGRIILNPRGQHFQSVDLRGERWSQRELARIVPLADLPGGAGGIPGDDRTQPCLADQAAALAQRMDVAVDLGSVLDGAAGNAQQVEMDGQEEFADNLQVGLGQQDVDVSHPAGNRILDGDHGQLGLAAGHQVKGVLEARARNTFQLGEHLLACDIGVGAGLTLVRNLLGHDPYGVTWPARPPNLATLWASSGPNVNLSGRYFGVTRSQTYWCGARSTPPSSPTGFSVRSSTAAGANPENVTAGSRCGPSPKLARTRMMFAPPLPPGRAAGSQGPPACSW